MKVYYNEIDHFAASWLRELISEGVLPHGDVDERDIRQVQASELKAYDQWHLFAGIGGWAHVLDICGLRDAESVLTRSCPCPPFSVAGKKKTCPQCGAGNLVCHVGRTGYFVCCTCRHKWLADERHLWPEMWRLIRDLRPRTVFSEQVAGPDARKWFAAVRASLQILGYRVGGACTHAGSFGGFHGRPRFYFVADTKRDGGRTDEPRRGPEGRAADGRDGVLADANGGSNVGGQSQSVERSDAEFLRESGELAGAENTERGTGERGTEAGVGSRRIGRGRLGSESANGDLGHATQRGLGVRGSASGSSGRTAQPEQDGVVEYPDQRGCEIGRPEGTPEMGRSSGNRCRTSDIGSTLAESGASALLGESVQPGLEGHAGNEPDGGEPGRQPESEGRPASPTSGVYWLTCRDRDEHGNQRVRPTEWTVEPRIVEMDSALRRDLGYMRVEGVYVLSPLIEKGKNRVGRLRGYGNAIDVEQARNFVEAYLESGSAVTA